MQAPNVESAKDWTSSASWQASLKFDKDNSQLKINMAHQGMTDKDMEQWCSWFEAHLEQCDVDRESLVACSVDFAENRLTDVGVKRLLDKFQECRVSVQVLKLHHNCLQSGCAIVELLLNCNGALRELHLSHNEIGTAAAAEIFLAAASAKDAEGKFCYPQAAPQGEGLAAPLWLRLDLNLLDYSRLEERLSVGLESIGREEWAFCDARGIGCKPRCCEWRRHPPPVHAKHLTNQRGKAATGVEELAFRGTDSVEPSVDDCASEADVINAEPEQTQARVYSREKLLNARRRIGDRLNDGPSVIKQICIPSHLVNDLSESAEHSDVSEAAAHDDQSCNIYVYDFDPEMFPTWEEFLPTTEFWPSVSWNWSEPKTTKSAQLLSTEPQASEYAQLLSILRRSPEGVVSLSSLQGSAPPQLRRLVEDASTLRSWLQQCMGAVEVFGPAGAELIAIKGNSESESSQETLPTKQWLGPESDEVESDEAMQFSFNPQAADFVPTKWPTFNPDATEFVPNSSPPVQDTFFSDEEEKLLGAQLCRDLADFGAEGRRAESPGSARTSAGEEETCEAGAEEVSLEETSEEEDHMNHIALATAEAIIA